MKKDEKYQLHLSWIEQSLESDKCTKWEEDFLHSIYDHLTRKGELSERQAEILERIYADRTD